MFKAYRHDPQNPRSLSNDIVTRMLVDREGSLWIATWNGLNRFDARTDQFSRYYFDPLKIDILYLELVQGPDEALWLGTHSSGLQRFDGKGKFMSYQRQSGIPGTLSDSRVNSVHFDRSGTMWLGTQNGLDRFDPKTSKFTTYTKQGWPRRQRSGLHP
jgi:ligand-binding sensor domain-containing protein